LPWDLYDEIAQVRSANVFASNENAPVLFHRRIMSDTSEKRQKNEKKWKKPGLQVSGPGY
jgi:hypothetical protein